MINSWLITEYRTINLDLSNYLPFIPTVSPITSIEHRIPLWYSSRVDNDIFLRPRKSVIVARLFIFLSRGKGYLSISKRRTNIYSFIYSSIEASSDTELESTCRHTCNVKRTISAKGHTYGLAHVLAFKQSRLEKKSICTSWMFNCLILRHGLEQILKPDRFFKHRCGVFVFTMIGEFSTL